MAVLKMHDFELWEKTAAKIIRAEGREQEDPMASSAVFSVEKPQNEYGVLGGIRAEVNGLGVKSLGPPVVCVSYKKQQSAR